MGDFQIAVCYDRNGEHIFYKREQVSKWLFTRANLEKRIVAANLEYDYAVCFQPFDDTYEVMLSNRKWIKAVRHDANKHAWTAFDIQRVAPLSVDGMGKVIGLSKYKTPPSLVRDPRYKIDEWYCDLHHHLWCVECYCVRDAEITYKFTVMYQQALNALGGEVKMTAASSSMDLFRRQFLTEEIPPTLPQRNTLARAAYYGGRVEAFKLGTSFDVKAYDFNSLYPAVMQTVEVGRPDTYRRVDAVRSPYKYLDKFGQFFGEIKLPDEFVGLLPFRQDNRLYFPTGQVKGSWMLSEVENAVRLGASIIRTDAVIYAQTTMTLFSGFVNTLYDLRQRYKDDGRPDELVVKLNMNSLYGKFAQHDDDGLQSLLIPPKRYDLEQFANDDPVFIAGREMFVRTHPTAIQSPHIHVLWAGEITAQARMRLLAALRACDDEIIYCDTDSIHTRGNLPIDTALGALKIEHDFSRACYFAPKEYGGQDKSGEMVHRAKGIPPAYRAEYLAKGAVEFKQPIHTLTAIRRGKRIAEWVTVDKHRRSDAMNRTHEPLPDFDKGNVTTYPFQAADLG